MYCPIVIGSDKTTVSVATGQLEYYPLYFSLGNLRNNVRRGHRNGVVPIGFLAIPKGMSLDHLRLLEPVSLFIFRSHGQSLR